MDDNRKWVYDSLKGKGVDLGSYEDYDKALNSEDSRKWVYDSAKKNGIDMGSYDDFSNAINPVPASIRRPNDEANDPVVATPVKKKTLNLSDEAGLSMSGWIGSKPYRQDVSVPERSTTQMLKPRTFETAEKEDTQRYMNDPVRQIDTEERGLKQDIAEQRKVNEANAPKGLWDIVKNVVLNGPGQTYEQRTSSPDIEAAEKRLRELEVYKTAVQEDREGDNGVQKAIGEVGRQLPETLRSIGTLGLSRVVDAITDAKRKGEDVGPLERSANELYDRYTQLNQLDYSMGRDIASGALQSAEYATQFAASGGLAAGATEGLGKIVASKLGGRLAAKAAGGAVEEIGKAVARTTVMPSTYSTAVDIMNKTGSGFPDAWGQSFTQNVIENFSEGVGEFMPSIGMSKNKFARKFMHASGIQGFPQEFAEEQIATVLHAMAGDGQGKWSDLIDPRNQLTTAGVLAVMQIPHVSIASGSYVSGKAGNIKQNYSINKAYNRNLTNLQDQFGGNESADSGEIVDFINNSVDNARSGKDMDALLDFVSNNEDLTDNQRDAIAKYAISYNAKAAMEKGRADAVEDRVKSEEEDIRANSDPSTWIYTEANRLVPNEIGEFIPVPGYIVGHIGGAPLWKPEGSGPDVQPIPLKPHEIQDVQSMPTQEVMDTTAQMIREKAVADTEREDRYDPQIQPPVIGTSFVGNDGAQIEIVQQNPNGGWIANMTTVDEKGKPQTQVVEITNDDYYNAKQRELDVQEDSNLSDLQQKNESSPEAQHNSSLQNNENPEQEDNLPETTTVQEQQEVPASQVIYKKDTKGNDTDEVDYEAMPVENTISHLNSLTGNDEATARSVEKTYTKASGSLESAQKALDKIESEGVDYTDRKEIAAYQKAKEAVASASARVNYWSTVNDELQSSRIQPGDKTAEAIRTMGDPVSGEELAASMLANGNLPILFSDYKKETGYSNSEGRKMVGLFANKSNGGMTVQEAGEKLMLADQENGTNFFDQSDPNAGRNAILDVLSQANTRGDLFNYIQSNREALAERERQAEYNAYSTWTDENYHMTPEDYETSESVIDEDLPRMILPDEDYNEFMSTFVDEQNTNNNETGRSKGNVAEIEQQGSSTDGEGGGEVLPETQSLPPERTGEPETESPEVDERINNENDTPQGRAQGREFVAPEYKGGSLLDYAEQVSKQKEVHDAGNEVDANPTEAQKEAGNYKKGHVKIDGLDITIENPKGSERSGVDKSGKKWSISMSNDYGYIRGTKAVDGDHVDVFLGPDLNSPKVYVVDQVNPDGSFDESKVMYGFESEDEARKAYLSNYEEGWQGLGTITEISKDNFKKWIDSSVRKTKPFAEYKIVQSEVPAMSEEEYLSSKGYGSFGIGEPALSKGKQKSDKQQNKIVESQAAKDKEYTDAREELRKEYRQKVESGELREPTTVENLIKVANGHPDLESTQAARRTLEKRGIDWENTEKRFRVGKQSSNEKQTKAVSDAVQSLSEKLNTPVRVINSVEELPEDVRKRVENGQRVKGWFDPKTGEVVVYSPHADSIEDVNRTVLHEVVGHKGLRALFGDKFDSTLHDIYKSLPKDVRAKIAQTAIGNFAGDTSIATEEYLAERAEKSETPSWWNKVVSGIRDFLRSVGINVEMSGNDVKYLLWRSRKNLESSDLLSAAEDIDMRRKMGIGEDETTKNYDGALQVAKDFSDNHSGSGSVFIVKSPDTIRRQLEAIGIEGKDIDKYEDWMKKGETRAFFSPKYDRIIVLDTSASKEELNSYLWHESTHKALSELEGRDDIVEIVSDFVRDNVPDIYTEVESLYKDDGEYLKREECTSSFIEALLTNGKEPLMNEGNVRIKDKKVNDAISKILNRINNGSESEKNQNEPRDIRRRGPGENSGSRSAEVEVRNPEGSKRFRTEEEHPSDGTRESYENALNEKGLTGYQAKEAYQDSMLSLKILQDVIAAKDGAKIKSFENAYLAENRMSSVSTREMEVFAKDYFRPLVEEVARMIKDDGVSYRDITDYLIAKHGLERNQILAERDAENTLKKEIEKIQQQLNSGYLNADERALLEKHAKDGSEFRQKIYNDALDRNLQNDYSGLTGLMKSLTDEKGDATAFAKELVSDFESRYNTDNLWKNIHAATEKTLRKSYESGLMSLDQYNELVSRFKNYIPLRGWDETMADEVYNYLDGNRSPVNSVMKGAKGRTSLADDPIATIGNMAESTILEGNRNIMKQHFLNFVTNHPSDLATVRDVWYVKDNATDEMMPSYPEIKENATPEEIAQAIDEHEQRMEELEKQGLAKKGRNGLDLRYKILPYQKSEHAVPVKRNGKEQVVYVNANPRAAQALNGKTNPDVEANPLFQAMGAFNRTLAKNFTTRNPAFVLSNLSRDLIFAHSAVSVKESPLYFARFSTNVPVSIATVFKGVRGIEDNSEAGKYFQEFLDNGGETGYANLRDVDRYKKMVQRDIKHLTKKDYFRSVRDGAELFNDFNRIAENISRFNTYLTSRQEGKDVVESIKDAKEITVNFNKKGSGYKALNPKQKWNSLGNVAAYSAGAMRNLFLFFNAGVQSLANFGGLAKKNAGKLSAVVGAFTSAGFMMPFINRWLMSLGGDGDDQDYYQNLTEWTRRNNLCVYIPYSKGDFVTIPLPIELRAFFGLGDLAYQYTVGNGDKKAPAIAYDALNQLTELLPLNPLGNNGDIVSTVMPDALKPIWQVHKNMDFIGRPIFKENDFNKTMPEWTKTYKGNSKMLIKLSEWSNEIGGGDKYRASDIGILNWNPAKVEHVLEGYFGGMATTLNQTGKTLSAGVESAVNGEKSDDLTYSNTPVLNRFIKDASDDRSSFRGIKEKFYNYLKEYEETEKNLRGYTNEVSSGNLDYLSKLIELQKSKDYQVYVTFKALKKPIDKIRQLEKKVGEDNSGELVRQKNELIKTVVHELDKVE